MHRRSVVFSVALALMAAAPAFAQPAVPPPPPQPTLWSFLGIPQGVNKVHGALFNRRGNHPVLEKKPPLKALADPRNLASDVPVIRKAAEVKMAEDLKQQKIKAIKYLADIGCGCYDTDGSITAAMVAATDDCTEDVRLAAVEAIADAASKQACSNCGSTCCCNEPILKRLAEMAYERDDKGCYLEPSARVREAAARALEICCPNTSPVLIEESTETPTPPVPPEALPPEALPPSSDGQPPLPPVIDGSVLRSPVLPRPRDSEYGEAEQQLGVVVLSDPQRGLAHVHLAHEGLNLQVGTRLMAFNPLPLGRQLTGELEVVEAFAGSVNVRAAGSTDLSRVRPGDHVIAISTPRGGAESMPVAVTEASEPSVQKQDAKTPRARSPRRPVYGRPASWRR